ncbi:MAG: BlaI/MecI/CopY family transcriptional regulator [Pirellulaceae bacterium]|nr:BlaI/MecI/CopY family transcriptional regulator [Pirellulaceae bacterium]
MKISDAEWRVMRVVWQRRVATAADVIESLAGETDWNHRTIRTLLGRLVEKGALAADQEANRYVYRPKVTQSRCVRDEARSFVDKVFDGDAAELLIHFVRNEAIPSEQLDELRRLLDAKGKEGNQ